MEKWLKYQPDLYYIKIYFDGKIEILKYCLLDSSARMCNS